MTDRNDNSDQRFPKQARLLRSDEFRRVLDNRCSMADGVIILYGAADGAEHARLGLVVSRAVGPAVVRNRWKRCLREAFRQVQQQLPAVDLVCIPRKGVRPDVARLEKSFRVLAGRIEDKLQRRILPPSNEPDGTGKRS